MNFRAYLLTSISFGGIRVYQYIRYTNIGTKARRPTRLFAKQSNVMAK